MHKNGPIIVIEDDLDDQEIIGDILKKLEVTNQVFFFGDGHSAFDYLNASDRKPFIILSDVNMPKMNGFQLKELIRTNELLSLKCIPFLFFTTGANGREVIDAYSLSVQGFFKKPTSMTELENTIKIMIDYWQRCVAPFES